MFPTITAVKTSPGLHSFSLHQREECIVNGTLCAYYTPCFWKRVSALVSSSDAAAGDNQLPFFFLSFSCDHLYCVLLQLNSQFSCFFALLSGEYEIFDIYLLTSHSQVFF